jgi:hypothetical protein
MAAPLDVAVWLPGSVAQKPGESAFALIQQDRNALRT